jgi:3,4-dihydroxy-2-butanone 4-phosphate synthase
MARRDDCWRFARTWGLKCISIADLSAYISGPDGKPVPA